MLYGDVLDAYNQDKVHVLFEILQEMHKANENQMFYELVFECFIAPLPHYWFLYLRSD